MAPMTQWEKRATAIGFWLAVGLLAPSCRPKPDLKPDDGAGYAEPAGRVRPGIEVLVSERLDLIRGKNVGLITNPSGVDGRLNSTISILRRTPGVNLVALYAPEHGVRGDAQAGEYVSFYVDPKYRLPVFSLYGPSQKPQPGMLKDIDEFMRSFDTTAEDKTVGPEMTHDIDVLVFDIQDIGTRVYTYAATMAYAMQTCAESGVEFVVLDRPNPITGRVLEGPVLEYPEFSSFIGLYPVPLRPGMTIGELARLINDRFLKKKAKLTVVPMKGWKPGMWFEETGLPWVTPSPNMPTVDTAVVYPGQVLIEGTNVSEGRGTTHPFEYFGAPWIDGYELTGRLNALRLPGVTFREQWFSPTFSKFRDERCGGCQIHVTDRNVFRPVRTSLHIISVLREMYPDQFVFHDEYFDKVCGTSTVRKALLGGVAADAIVRGFEKGLGEFEVLRKPYLLY
ncbi:MAG: DUF1343 domain-containing protein [Candidatus Aminicenantes bacterium]|nr:DUF1343 domain-containing protein [Candidatus Aminicenantes bacterium]